MKDAEVKEVLEIFKRNKNLSHIGAKGEVILREEGPAVALQAVIEACSDCGEFQRWTPLYVRQEIRRSFYPAARAAGIPASEFQMVI